MDFKFPKIFLFALALLFVPYVALSFFCHPAGDDFTCAIQGSAKPYLEAVFGEYVRWDGRYTANFPLLANPIRWNSYLGYQLSPILLIILAFLFSFLTFKKGLQLPNKTSVTFSGILLLLYFSTMPDLSEGIYWYTGAWTYFSSAFLFSFHIGNHVKSLEKSRAPNIILSIVLQLIITGLNETIMLYLLLVHFGLFFFSIKRKRKTNIYLILLLLQIAFCAIVFLSPGTLNREAHFENAGKPLHTLLWSTIYTGRFFTEWLANPGVWLFIIVSFFYFRSKKETFHHPIYSNFWFISIAAILPLYLACFAPIWATGIIGQHRTPNLALWLLLMHIFFSLKYNWQKIPNFRLLNWFSRNLKWTFLSLFLALGLWKNGLYSALDLGTGKAAKFSEEMHSRYRLLDECSKENTKTPCYIPYIKNKPKSIFVYDICENPDHWFNDNFARFYGVSKKGRVVLPKTEN